LTQFILKKETVDLELWNRIKKSWFKVEKSVVGRKNCLAREAYTQWVKNRILDIKLPFITVVPMVPQEPEPLVTISKEEVEALKSQIEQLKKENEELQFKYFSAQGDAKNFKRERDAKDEEIQECKKKVKEAQGREEKYKDGLASSDMSIMALKKKIKSLERSGDDMYNTGKKAMIAQGEWKKRYEERTQELRIAKQDYKKLKQEGELELQKRERLHSLEKQKDKESIERYEESLAQLMRAHEDRMNQAAEQIEHLEKDLKHHKLVIEMSLQEMARWKVAFHKMVLVSNSVLDELPQMLRVAEAELPLLSVPSGVKEFVGYCRAVVTAYKNIVKKAKKRL
jgi:DNA repair exonuclease SbcCD ATPase subunit